MATKRLDAAVGAACSLGDVIGVHTHPNAANPAPLPVNHVAVLAENLPGLLHGGLARVHQMSQKARPSCSTECNAHIVADFSAFQVNLGAEIVKQVTDLETRTSPLTYKALPHYTEIADPHSAISSRIECSCVGMIVHAIEVVFKTKILDPAALGYPKTTLATLRLIYPNGFLERRDKAGLAGDGPWPLVLPGHLLHALNQPAGGLPYVPGAGDWRF